MLVIAAFFSVQFLLRLDLLSPLQRLNNCAPIKLGAALRAAQEEERQVGITSLPGCCFILRYLVFVCLCWVQMFPQSIGCIVAT